MVFGFCGAGADAPAADTAGPTPDPTAPTTDTAAAVLVATWRVRGSFSHPHLPSRRRRPPGDASADSLVLQMRESPSRGRGRKRNDQAGTALRARRGVDHGPWLTRKERREVAR